MKKTTHILKNFVIYTPRHVLLLGWWYGRRWEWRYACTHEEL